MNKEYKNFELVDHTADIGLKIYGKNKKELFINAARGMFYLITGSLITISCDKSFKKYYLIECQASTIEDLIVNWLNELLYIHVTEFVICDNYDIHFLNKEMIKSKVSAIKIKDTQYRIYKEIKAVTYHNLRVYQKQNGIWVANIVFDI